MSSWTFGSPVPPKVEFDNTSEFLDFYNSLDSAKQKLAQKLVRAEYLWFAKDAEEVQKIRTLGIPWDTLSEGQFSIAHFLSQKEHPNPKEVKLLMWLYANGYPKSLRDQNGRTVLDGYLDYVCGSSDIDPKRNFFILKELHKLPYSDTLKNGQPLLYGCRNPKALTLFRDKWGLKDHPWKKYLAPIDIHRERRDLRTSRVFVKSEDFVDYRVQYVLDRQRKRRNRLILASAIYATWIAGHSVYYANSDNGGGLEQFHHYTNHMAASAVLGGIAGIGLGVLFGQNDAKDLFFYQFLPGVVLGGVGGYFLARWRWDNNVQDWEKYAQPVLNGVPVFFWIADF